jgi:hypothetical protein
MFQERRDMLKQLIQKQTAIAKQLAQSEGEYSRDTMWARDVTDELTNKLRLVETSLAHIRVVPVRDATPHDSDMAKRDYEL